jgi:hypothetical protein
MEGKEVESLCITSELYKNCFVTKHQYQDIIGSPLNLHKDHKSRRFDYATDMGCDLSYDIPSGELGERS